MAVPLKLMLRPQIFMILSIGLTLLRLTGSESVARSYEGDMSCSWLCWGADAGQGYAKNT